MLLNALKKFINFMIQKQRHQILAFQILIVWIIKNIHNGFTVYATKIKLMRKKRK